MSKTKYPTKKEILTLINKSPPPKTLLIKHLKTWKKLNYTKKWKNKTPNQKQQSLCILIFFCFYKNSLKLPDVYWDTHGWRYDRKTNRIYGQPNNLSILSTLHETGHALHGASELKACAFSIGIFKEVFPKEYSRLEWKKHMLIKKLSTNP